MVGASLATIVSTTPGMPLAGAGAVDDGRVAAKPAAPV